ncbi:hypothetical protein I7I51_04824 [Histoplasma capsulatum]|uniref:Uncharacterized protein n=1 Tax=Ajellomyces capsulatus TaxID=5037 RepID=A0A8A1M0P1_AJECA|nr:hypothetical protein I7I51_04824 [Histoplasma capsulatum]
MISIHVPFPSEDDALLKKLKKDTLSEQIQGDSAGAVLHQAEASHPAINLQVEVEVEAEKTWMLLSENIPMAAAERLSQLYIFHSGSEALLILPITFPLKIYLAYVHETLSLFSLAIECLKAFTAMSNANHGMRRLSSTSSDVKGGDSTSQQDEIMEIHSQMLKIIEILK